MTREEAIQMQLAFKRLYVASHIQEACDLAIEALKFQQGTVRCKDCGSCFPDGWCRYHSRHVTDESYCWHGYERD